jgi:hypothetical protein
MHQFGIGGAQGTQPGGLGTGVLDQQFESAAVRDDLDRQ